MENTFDLKKFLIENKLTPNSNLIKEEQTLSPEEQRIVDDILKGLDEGVFDNVLQKVKTYAKKGLLTAAVVTALLATPSLTQAQKQDIKQVASTEMAAPTTADTSTIKMAVKGSVLSINFNQTFSSGKATLTKGDDLQMKVGELQEFLKGKDASKFKIVIVAGESQVTNQAPYQKVGSLAQARAKAVESIVSKLGSKVEIETKIGTTPYKKGDNANDESYTNEQFVTVNVVVDNDICSMKPVSTNQGQGVESKNYVTFDEYLSGKGTLEMSTGTIPDRVVILDANGNIKQDTGYTTTHIKDGDWQYTPLYVLELTKAYMKGNISMKDIDPKTIITVKDKYDLYNKLKKATVSNPSLEGSEVNGPLREMEGMIRKGINTFVIYNIGTSNVKLNFDDSKGDVQAKVYSPVGKTGYSIGASCGK
jgi:flagellar motor protein MotB